MRIPAGKSYGLRRDSITGATIATYVTVQAVGLIMGAPCIALYRYHGGTIVDTLRAILNSTAVEVLGAISGLVIFGTILTFIPTFGFSAALATIIRRAVHRNWPPWTTYVAAVGLMAILFFGLVSLTPRPIPDLAMYFQQAAPNMQRPGLSASEVPLLAASLVSGLAGAWVCGRVLRSSLVRHAIKGRKSVAEAGLINRAANGA